MAPHSLVSSRSRLDTFAPLISALAVFTVYWWTLQPDVGGPEDTPKFQYLGYVLGTAHSPGYPLYTILTHLFAYLPVGTLAWRMNLFSAVCGAVTIAFAWGCARQLGASRIAATGAACALGLGRYFWWNAILAEVYTLGAALLAAMVFFLLRWADTRRDRDLHIAVACAALALGNHLTIVAVAPAALAFTLAVDWRAALRPRTLLINVAIGAAGLAQYLYIIVRTRQRAAFLESRASTIAELLPIVRAERFSDDVFSFSPAALLTERLPDLLGHVLAELGWCGAALVLGGLVLLSMRRWRHAVLIAGGALGAFALALNVAADVKGFLMPVFTIAWPAAALGIDGLARILGQGGRLRVAVAAGSAILLPAGLAMTNARANNLHDATATSRYVGAIFASLPARAAFVFEEYTIDNIMTYESIVHPAANRKLERAVPRDPAVINALIGAGYAVFAFREGANSMLMHDREVNRVLVRGPDVRSILDAFPSDHIVIVAAARPGLPPSFAPRARRATGWQAAGLRRHHVVLAHPRQWDTAMFDSRGVPFGSRFGPGAAPESLGGTIPREIHVDVRTEAAAILIDGREVIRAAPGTAVAVLAPDGSIPFRQAWPPGVPLETVLDVQQPALYRVGNTMTCTALGDRAWRDITPLAAATSSVLLRIDNYRPAAGELVVYALADDPFAPVLRNEVESPPQRLDVRAFDVRDPAARVALQDDLRRDGVSIPVPIEQARHAVRVRAVLPDNGDSAAARLYFGTDVRHVIARGTADRVASHRAGACAVPWPPVIGQWTPTSGEVWLGPATAEYFSTGWRGAEKDDMSARAMRWTAEPRARLRIPMPLPAPTQVQVTVEPAPGVTAVALEVNSTRMSPVPLRAGWQDVEWNVPAHAWRDGVNDVWIVGAGVSQSTGRMLHVNRIRLEQQR